MVIDMCMQCSYRLGHGVGINHDLIASEVSTLLDDPEAYDKMSKAVNPYGDGSHLFCVDIENWFLSF